MQIVIISNRPTVAEASLEYTEALMPFLTEVVYVCPEAQADRFREVASSPERRLKVTVVCEEELLGDERVAAFRTTRSHVVKNWLLRSSLPELPDLGDDFILSDDDYRPLFEIPLETFVEGGRSHAYFNHELTAWRANETDYDRGQRRTAEALARRGFPTLSYSSHMPQMIHTRVLTEVAREFAEETERGEEIEEWSLYFNAARALHPELFHSPRPFRTLCWPALPTDWQLAVRPEGPLFENFYPELYAPGGLFEGIPERFDAAEYHRHSEEKIRRRADVQRVYDSATAALLRRSAWALRRLLLACDQRLTGAPAMRRAMRWCAPGPVRRFVRDAMRHGDDPAWSFPWSKTQYVKSQYVKTHYHSRRESLDQQP